MGALFGTDGVRGLANQDLTPELAFQLGRAGAAFLRGHTPNAHPVVLVGKDTRRSGDMLEAALIAGICSVGVHVRRLGVVPTPAVAWLTTREQAAAGIMISASHNPAPDNGIKFFGTTGFKLPDAVEDSIEALMNDPDAIPRPVGMALGRVTEGREMVAGYIDNVASLVPAGLLNGLKVVVDCGHGAAYELGPALLRRLGAEVIALSTEPDGDNINRDCGSTHLELLQEAVLAAHAQLGLAFDGDADRLLAIDETGKPVDGDRIMLICLGQMVAAGRAKGNSVVSTVMSNLGFEEAVKQLGGELVRAKVGDRYVLEEMLARDIRIGGEQSGHVIFLDDNTTGDGLITAVRLLEAVVSAKEPLSRMAARMTSYPQLLHNLRVGKLAGWQENAAIQNAISTMSAELAGSGRILVRASGTEALLRVMVEGKDQAQIESVAARLDQVIMAELGPAVAAR